MEIWSGAHTIWLSCCVESITSFPMPMVICSKTKLIIHTTQFRRGRKHWCFSHKDSLTSFRILTFAVSPSSCSSFWLSRSSAKRWPFTWWSSNGDDRPDVDRSRRECGGFILGWCDQNSTRLRINAYQPLGHGEHVALSQSSEYRNT